jgi:hypothetical protein
MFVKRLAVLALTSALFPSPSAAGFADAVVQYTPGSGVQAAYTDAAAALGEPSRATGGAFPGPVDPFSPPYLPEQVVSLGAGGSLTLRFDTPIQNDPSNPFGLDFIVFGNAGFIITNGDFTGGGITDGSLFGANEGMTRVLASSDGENFFELTPSLAPVLDGPFPTDGAGDFHIALDPALRSGDFAGKDMAGIRALYRGSAGGAAYDLAWARDAQGQPANLSSATHLRLLVVSGMADIDGVAVVPEPGVLALLVLGGTAIFVARRNRS